MLKNLSASSQKDRINFYTMDNSVTAIRNENMEISFEYGKNYLPIKRMFFILICYFGIPSILKSIVIMPLIKIQVISSIWYILPAIFYFILMVYGILDVRKKGGKELLKNHGAEHMVFAAYKKLKRVPTVKQAEKFSRISRVCGVTIYSAYITCQLIGFVIYTTTNYVIPEILLYLAPVFFQTIFPFNLIGKLAQFFTTSHPEDSNIELAIAALSELEKITSWGYLLSIYMNNAFR